jgi:hypothetical protein
VRYIGIIGSRSRDTEHDFLVCIDRFFEVYEEGDAIVSGGCPRGGDRFAEEIAKYFEIPIVIFPADWDVHGKAAGFIRNTQIAEKSDVLIALVTKDRSRCKGTMNTVGKVTKMNKVVILDEDEEVFDPENICQ